MSARRFRAQARSVGRPPRSSQRCTTRLARASAAQTASKDGTGSGARLKAQPPSLQSLRAWDEATSAISNASARASLLRSVHPDAAMRDAGERCEQEAEALSTELALDPEVYAPLSRIDASGEDEETCWYLFRVLRDFRRAGVDKDAQARARARAMTV